MDDDPTGELEAPGVPPAEPAAPAPYDSRPETYEHIREVQARLVVIAGELMARALMHDESKLEEPELAMFNEFTPRLRALTYGSEEYKATTAEMGPALVHHYAENDHHPEHFAGGVGEMNLVQVLEMLCDWKAATLRHDDGDIHRSIEQNRARFGYGPELAGFLHRTADWLEFGGDEVIDAEVVKEPEAQELDAGAEGGAPSA